MTLTLRSGLHLGRGPQRGLRLLGGSVQLGVGGLMSVEIAPDGHSAYLTFKGQTTGGTYNFGLGINGNPAAGVPRLVFTVTSKGFDDNCDPTTIVRTVYGTYQIRKPYPDQAQNQESVFGTADVTIRVALSDYIYVKDQAGASNSGTDIQVSVSGGLYTVGGVPSLGGSGTALNNSGAAYPKVVGNWAWPGYDKVGATITPRAVAFHHSAQQGRPVRAVKFTATGDTSGAVVTQTVTAMTIDGSVGDAKPVPEYVGSLSTNTLTQAETVTLRAQAYPWVGDTASVLDTLYGTTGPTPYVGPIKVLCDKAGTYCQSFAVVDPVSGNDGTGVVGFGTLDTGSPPAAFLTKGAAYNALRTYNNSTYGRNNGGGSILWQKEGNADWVGSSVTVGTAPQTWLIVKRYPGASRANTNIATSTTGGKSLGLMLKLEGLRLTSTSGSGTFSAGAGSMLWTDQCEYDVASNPLIYIQTVFYVTRCLVTRYTQGFRAFSVNASAALIRGCELGVLGISNPYTMLGNKSLASNALQLNDSSVGAGQPPVTGCVIAYNYLRTSLSASSNPLLSLKLLTLTESNGMANVQNVFETSTNSTVPLVTIAADSSTGDPVNNVIEWHNTYVGQRVNMAYNDINTSAPSRRGWSRKNNIYDDVNIKSDTFNGTGGPSGLRVGNWSALYGVGASGNYDNESTGIGASGTAFQFEFPGLSSYQPVGAATNAPTVIGFVDRKSYNGSIAGTGGGDYHLASGSPAKGLCRDWVLPFDLDGAARTSSSDPGAYAA